MRRMKSYALMCVCFLVGLTYSASPAMADPAQGQYWVGGQLHAAVFSDIVETELFDIAGGLSLSGGYRFADSDWSLTLVLDNTWWAQPNLEPTDRDDVFNSVAQGSINLGVGVQREYFDEHLRWGLTIGPTFLIRRTNVDRPGTVGLFLDMRPTGLKFALGNEMRMVLDPLVFTMMIPDFSGIPLVLLLYRTVVSVEMDIL